MLFCSGFSSWHPPVSTFKYSQQPWNFLVVSHPSTKVVPFSTLVKAELVWRTHATMSKPDQYHLSYGRVGLDAFSPNCICFLWTSWEGPFPKMEVIALHTSQGTIWGRLPKLLPGNLCYISAIWFLASKSRILKSNFFLHLHFLAYLVLLMFSFLVCP